MAVGDRTPEKAALILKSASPDNINTLHLLLRSGLAKHPTAKMVQRHIHPRHKRPKV